jgi:hypothetical protein
VGDGYHTTRKEAPKGPFSCPKSIQNPIQKLFVAIIEPSKNGRFPIFFEGLKNGEGGILRPIHKTTLFQRLNKNRLGVFGAVFCSKKGLFDSHWDSNECRMKEKEHLCE